MFRKCVIILCCVIHCMVLLKFECFFFFAFGCFCRNDVGDGGEFSASQGRPKRLLTLSQKSLEAFEMPTDSDT